MISTSQTLRNTTNAYGTIAKWLHWLTAALFLLAYFSVYYRHWFTEAKTPENWIALHSHLSIGLSLAVIVALRIIWRLMNRVPEPEPGTRFEHMAAHLGHYSLYAVMIVMPITGYLGTGIDTQFFFLFDITGFKETAVYAWLISNGWVTTFETFELPLDFLHKEILGSYIIWMLILGHVLAALYHHFIKRDRTLYKMTFSNYKD